MNTPNNADQASGMWMATVLVLQALVVMLINKGILSKDEVRSSFDDVLFLLEEDQETDPDHRQEIVVAREMVETLIEQIARVRA